MTIESLGHYDILEPLGSGGMGDVYRARDRRLERELAIKVLPADVAADPERLRRFEREARMLALLNHPNVGSIYGLERAGNTTFLALELIAGDDLTELLSEGPLREDSALEFGVQIARALEAAHERGIVHRDLKPSNIKVTPAQIVKVLDFGLAKLEEEETPETDASPTLAPGHTDEGTILGTAAYMSPEQARGRPLDTRADIWAFGCVLFEMLTGRSAFGRETISDTLVAILEYEPDWTALPDDLPPAIRRLLERCLRPDPDRRLHHIADARIVMEDVLEADDRALVEKVVGGGVGAAGHGYGPLALLGVALAGILVGHATRAVLGAREEANVALPRVAEVARITHDPGSSEWPTWSPDAQLLAFASNRGGDFDIYVRRVQGGQEVNVSASPGDDYQPSFSPDGEWIAFVSTRRSSRGLVKIGATFGMEFRTFGGDIWLVPALGGRARRLAERGNAPAWHPDGRSVIYLSGREDHRSIVRVTLDGARDELLPESESRWELVRVHYSPDGRWITFDTVNPEQVMIMPASGGEARLLLAGLNHLWAPDGERLYYLARDPAGGSRLLSVGFDPASGTVHGEPATHGLMTGTLRDLTLAADGRSFAAMEMEGSLNLTLLPLNAAGDAPAGDEIEVSPGLVIDRYPRFSADGNLIAVASDRLGREEVWLHDRRSRDYERLELPGEDQGVNLPYFAPDGRELYLTRFFADGRRSIWRTAVDGSGAEELVAPSADDLQGSPPSPDGRWLLYNVRAGAATQLFTLDLASGASTQLTHSPGDKYSGSWSPDGKSLVFTSNATGAVQLWTLDLETGEETRLTDSEERIRHAFFSPDGRWIYYQPNHLNVYRMPASGGPAIQVTRFPTSGLFLEEPTLSPDGRWLAYCRSNGGSSIWVMRLDEEGAES